MPDPKTPSPDTAHDVLAAEEFAVPGRDPFLRHGPVTLPGDPSGIAEPHDVLAAEEFAIPSHPGPAGSDAKRSSRWARNAAVGALAFVVLRRLGRKRFT